MIFFLETYSIYTNGFQIPHLKKKKKKPGLVRVRPSPGSTRRAGPGLITVVIILALHKKWVHFLELNLNFY